MARRCDLTGKGVLSGNLVSHSNRKTRTRFLPNVQEITFISDVLSKKFVLSVCMSTLRTVEAKGGFDNFLLNTANLKLTEKAKKIKREIQEASKAA